VIVDHNAYGCSAQMNSLVATDNSSEYNYNSSIGLSASHNSYIWFSGSVIGNGTNYSPAANTVGNQNSMIAG
jgi:hypothetical protein